MRMTNIGEETRLYGWLKDLTVYSSNFGELKDSKNNNSKIKYRVWSTIRILFEKISSSFSFEDRSTDESWRDHHNQQSNENIRHPSFWYSRQHRSGRRSDFDRRHDFFGRFTSFNEILLFDESKRFLCFQSVVLEEKEKLQTPLLFVPRPLEKDQFWFATGEKIIFLCFRRKIFFSDSSNLEIRFETDDAIGVLAGAPAELKLTRIEEKNEKEPNETKQIVKEQVRRSLKVEISRKIFLFKLIFTLETVEVKLELGVGAATKSVVAMCFSNLTADLKNWSSEVGQKKKSRRIRNELRFRWVCRRPSTLKLLCSTKIFSSGNRWSNRPWTWAEFFCLLGASLVQFCRFVFSSPWA